MAATNRRKDQRLAISLPIRVQGHSSAGVPWEEMTQCEDASTGGAAFRLKHYDTFHGQVLFLSLPLPKRYRRYDPTTPTYLVYAIVESVQLRDSGVRVGVSFIGRKPPAGFEKNPGARYSPERRSRKRGTMFLRVRLHKPGSEEDERTVLENYGAGGARVMTGRVFTEGEVVEIEDSEGSFKTRAEVRSVYMGQDGIRRINLRFLG
jgi:hypothetical protein